MQLRYTDATGNETILRLGTEPVIIGRAPESDVAVKDTKASRNHCEVRLWDGAYVLKDLKSRNGTLLNGIPCDIAILSKGDQIRIGDVILTFEEKAPMGASTALRAIAGEMQEGKGYRTILREIVNEASDSDGSNA